MNTTEPLTEEAALWASVGEMPGDQLRRLVLADWYEERAGVVKCERCNGLKWVVIPYPAGGFNVCPRCSGTGYVPNGFADTAAALRTTADRVPQQYDGIEDWSWSDTKATYLMIADSSRIEDEVYKHLDGYRGSWISWHDYPTAADAIRDLCRAWVKVHREGTA